MKHKKEQLLPILLEDFALFNSVVTKMQPRSYQLAPGRAIYEAVLKGQGGRFTVMFPRQSGKNELQSHLEYALLTFFKDIGGQLVKIAPTYRPQLDISFRRLKAAAEEDRDTELRVLPQKHQASCGKCTLKGLSAAPGANIVGDTASILLEADEAQSIQIRKFDEEVAPMAASANAVTVFWGTAWDESTLLAREFRAALRSEEAEGNRHAFRCTADDVGKEVPAYREFVEQKVKTFGRDHPIIRTQYFCEEISEKTGMFPAERLRTIHGSHTPQEEAEEGQLIVFLIDVAGSDELTPEEKREDGFSDSRDSTALTICEITEQNGVPIWKCMARRSYTNVPRSLLLSELTNEIDRWHPLRIAVDHTGLGAGLCADIAEICLEALIPIDITGVVKSRMAWELLRHFPAGHWLEYSVPRSETLENEKFTLGKDPYEVLRDPAELQNRFFDQLHACRMFPGSTDPNHIRWGVPNSARDAVSGRLLHDDLVLSMALFTEIYDSITWIDPTADPIAAQFDPDFDDDLI